MDNRAQVREFLASRRARITPDQAGLPAYGGNRRVKGLRREEVALLAGVSIDYYIRMERGDLRAPPRRSSTASRTHCNSTTPSASTCRHWPAPPAQPRRARPVPATVRPVIQQVLDAITEAPAWIRNARHDILAANPLARALYSPVLESAAAGPTGKRAANTTRFIYLDPAAREFFVDYDRMATDAAAMLRLEAGRNPHDKALVTLIGELSTQSELFRQHWASHNVKFHRSGRKRLRHPAVGELDLNFEAMELPSEPDFRLNLYTADPGIPTADGLKLLASWAATRAADNTGTRDAFFGLSRPPLRVEQGQEPGHGGPVAGGPGRAGRRAGELCRQFTATQAMRGMQEQGSPHHGDIVAAALVPGSPLRVGDRRDLRRAQIVAAEHRVQASGFGNLRVRIIGDDPGKLVTGQDDDAGPHLKQTADLGFQGDGDLGGVRARAGEDQIPALDVGGYLGMAERGGNLPEVRHRHPVTAAEVDRAQQGNVGPHGSILPCASCVPSFLVRHYRPASQSGALPCLYWIHGGGHVVGQVDQDDLVMDHIVDAVGGASSGGGSTAGLVLLARDLGEVGVCFQLLIYPMLDDRNVTPASVALTDPRV